MPISVNKDLTKIIKKIKIKRIFFLKFFFEKKEKEYKKK